MEKEYNIPISQDFRKDVSSMCNLSEGLEERVTKKVTKEVTKSVTDDLIMNMYKNHFTLEQMALAANRSVEEINDIIKENLS